jgi:hypothetical protein
VGEQDKKRRDTDKPEKRRLREAWTRPTEDPQGTEPPPGPPPSPEENGADEERAGEDSGEDAS